MLHSHTAYIYAQQPSTPLPMRHLIQTFPYNHLIPLRRIAAKNLRAIGLDHRRPLPRKRRREVNLHSTPHSQKSAANEALVGLAAVFITITARSIFLFSNSANTVSFALKYSDGA